MRRVAVDAERPSRDVLLAAADIIRNGGIVAMPTETLYGLAADPFSPAAIARLFDVKGRAAERAIALVAADVIQINELVQPLLPLELRLANAFWPGPLTLLVGRPASIPAELTGGRDRVGVRVPAHEVTRTLCRASSRVLTATSANLTGEPATADPDVVARVFASSDVDLLLDAGRTPGGAPSTIVEVLHDDSVRLIRPGAIDFTEVQACAQHR
ncbi:MAG TPA: L-threonylcarbamoyladenylate synthase [Vicinamibacterales bacterium]|nr:L-threonylcarbamoyladenylate synthase [Vicinamibacterales bacterium]